MGCVRNPLRPPVPSSRMTATGGSSDDLLVPLCSAQNVSFTASRSTWSSAVSKVLVTMLMLWVPMLPLMFLLRRMMDSRTGGR